jgi:hypothetical protein
MCGFVTTLSGGVWDRGWGVPPVIWGSLWVVNGCFLLEHGLTFGVVGEFSYTCVYVEFLWGKECLLLPPRFAQRAGRRS